MVRIFGKKYEDDVERYYRERRKKELEQSKNSNREGSDYDGGILDYIRIEDREGVDESSNAEDSKASGCLLYFLFFVFMCIGIFGVGSVFLGNGGKEKADTENANTFESDSKEYDFLSYEVDNVCKIVYKDGGTYLITSDKYNEYLSLITGCIEMDRHSKISTYEDGAKTYFKQIYNSFVSYTEYSVKEYKGRYYMELLLEADRTPLSIHVVEEIVRELLKGYNNMISETTKGNF